MLEQQQKYTFVRSMSSLSKREKWILLVPVLLLLSVFIWAGYWELFQPEDWKKILESGKDWNKYLPIVLPYGLLLVVQGGIEWLHRSSKLVIDGTGVLLEWPSDSVFAKWKFLQKRFAWTDVKRASYMLGSRGVVLLSKTNSILWTIRLKDWKFSSVEPSRYAIKSAEIDLLSVFRELDIFEDASNHPFQFDLMKHPVTRSILLGIVILVAYVLLMSKYSKKAGHFLILIICFPILLLPLLRHSCWHVWPQRPIDASRLPGGLLHFW